MLRPKLPKRIVAAQRFVVHEELPFIGKPNWRVRVERYEDATDESREPNSQDEPRKTANETTSAPRASFLALERIQFSDLQKPSLAESPAPDGLESKPRSMLLR
jgi:hypothetical protein